MDRAPLAALVVLLALLGGALAAPAVASPQPRPVCGYCGAEFATAAADQGVEAEVAESTAVVQVHEDGSATWTVRNRLSSGAEAFRNDSELLDSVVEDLQTQRSGLPDDVGSVEARVDGDVVVLTVRDHDAASRHAGVLVVDFLHDGERNPWYVVNADRFTVRGPEGSVVINDPASGRVDGGAVTWRGSSPDRWDAPRLTGSPYVAFGADRSAGMELRTHAALALATLPLVVESVLEYVLLPAIAFSMLLGAVVVGIGYLGGRGGDDPDEQSTTGAPGTGPAERPSGHGSAGNRLAKAIAVVSGAVAVLLISGHHLILAGPALFGLGVGLVGSLSDCRSYLRTPRRLAVAATGSLVGTFVVLLLAGSLVDLTISGPLEVSLRGTVVAFPLAAAFALGGALATDRGRPLAWAALTVVAFATVIVSLYDPGNPPGGLAAVFLFIAGFVVAIVYPLVGAPVIALGRSLVVSGRVQ